MGYDVLPRGHVLGVLLSKIQVFSFNLSLSNVRCLPCICKCNHTAVISLIYNCRIIPARFYESPSG